MSKRNPVKLGSYVRSEPGESLLLMFDVLAWDMRAAHIKVQTLLALQSFCQLVNARYVYLWEFTA